MTPSRLITGLILSLGGLAIILVSIFTTAIFIIYGLVALVVGIAILINNREDRIEQIKRFKK